MTPPTSGNMPRAQLGDILRPEVIKIGLRATNKAEAIEELVDLLVEAGEVPESIWGHVCNAVHERERLMSTGMEEGVALPHGSTDGVRRVVGALGISPEGIPFESLDEHPAKIIALLVLPKQEFQVHVRTLAGVAHLLSDAAFRAAILAANDARDILEYIRSVECEEADRNARNGDAHIV